ncbi:MAG: DUF2231 domain-containing protein [Polyangiaceae bacterium]|nr:DUF2231 domain-containing protein [Polyangiaceae bacterium]
MAGTSIERAIGEQEWVERAAEPVQRAVSQALERAPRIAGALHGEWLGHPLHAALTDVPVGAWFAGFVLDMGEVLGGSRRLRRGADAAIAVGLAGSLGAAVAGIADWSETRDEAKRVGFVHGATNAVIAGLYGASLYARSRRRRGLGIALSTVGYGLLIFSSWLGGQLSYRLGVGVRGEAFERKQLGGRAEQERPASVTEGEPAAFEPPASFVEAARAESVRR